MRLFTSNIRNALIGPMVYIFARVGACDDKPQLNASKSQISWIHASEDSRHS